VPHSCFADEIAIDFPAVGRVVDGMRDAFFGETEGPDVVAADVSVSKREAAGGSIVPLAVPVRGTCPTCGGRGESWTEPCVECGGTGASVFNHAVRLALPAGVVDGAVFRFRLSSPQTGPVRVEVRVAVQPSLV
jgi:DnaJ-class molecular chaperone